MQVNLVVFDFHEVFRRTRNVKPKLFLDFFYQIDPKTVTHSGSTTNTDDVYSGKANAPPLVDLDGLYDSSDVNTVQRIAAKFVN